MSSRPRLWSNKLLRLLFFSLACLCLPACSNLTRNPVPPDRLAEAQIVGMPPETRAFGLSASKVLQADFAKAMVDGGVEQACDKREGQPVFCVLIISGGGGYGAYGAGLLNGWSQSGTRPRFKIVTGISTGALIAPFAFLGSEWDDEITEAYTSIETDGDVVSIRNILGILTSDSVATTEGLEARIAHFVTPRLLSAVAREHRSGRRLYIGTTNMDAQSFTVWNMGAIAASDHPDAIKVFRKVLLASASIPILMPPVFFDVSLDGRLFDEMHADGGVQAQFFVPLAVINLPEAIADAQSRGFAYTPSPRMYVIRNAKFRPEPKAVDRSLGAIAGRTVSSMIQAMGRSDLYQIYAIARVRGNDFRYTEVPADFVWNAEGEFDGPEMRRLYSIGYKLGQDPNVWSRTPPGLFADNTK